MEFEDEKNVGAILRKMKMIKVYFYLKEMLVALEIGAAHDGGRHVYKKIIFSLIEK